jgi:hypothetical protein
MMSRDNNPPDAVSEDNLIITGFGVTI